MTTKPEQTVTTEEWEQALEVVRKQAVEIDRLRALLRRWEVQSKYLNDCFQGHRRWKSEALIRLTEATTEVLK